MPYIPEDARPIIDNRLMGLIQEPLTAGELAYVVTRVTLSFINHHSKMLTYVTLAMAIGVLVLTTVEIIRRVVIPYEDAKAKENGDVFEDFLT